MKSLIVTGLILTTMLTAGCLQSSGGKEVPSNLNNEDFSVITEPEDGSGGNPPDEGGIEIPENPINPVGIDINKGGVITGSQALALDMYPPFRPGFMKISDNGTCADGSWIDYEDSKQFVTAKKDQVVPVSVQFRDHDGRVSACYDRSIYVDRTGPAILFSKYPSGVVEAGTDVEIVFSVTDAGVGVDKVTCAFGSISKSCGAGTNKITFPSMAEGDYKLTVNATDKYGNASSNAVSFKVTSLYKNMAQTVTVTSSNKVDILFVVDNSGSMAYEQQSMASRVRNFLDVVNGLDWQIAVTTTDPSNSTYGDGRLVTMKGLSSTYILNSSMNATTARTVLSNTLQRTETGSGSEQGIFAAYRAIERSQSSSGGNTNFIRANSQLAVVVISDEDESANGAKNDPSNFIKFVQDSYGSQKAMSFHSIISRPGDKACKDTEGYSYGYRYEQISKLTGGVIGDVCATDYAAQVQGIAEGVRKTLKTISLSCAPVIDASHSVSVVKDGQAYTATRKMEGLNLVFDDMLPAGSYEVYYTCLK